MHEHDWKKIQWAYLVEEIEPIDLGLVHCEFWFLYMYYENNKSIDQSQI